METRHVSDLFPQRIERVVEDEPYTEQMVVDRSIAERHLWRDPSRIYAARCNRTGHGVQKGQIMLIEQIKPCRLCVYDTPFGPEFVPFPANVTGIVLCTLRDEDVMFVGGQPNAR